MSGIAGVEGEERSDLSQFLDNLLFKIAVVVSNVFYKGKEDEPDAVEEMKKKLGL